jgi:putative acetyltransferase
VAQAILARLEDEARKRGYARVTLETGDVLDAAMRLYQRAGFTPCPPFGDYAELPAPNIERSRFFEKAITAT